MLFKSDGAASLRRGLFFSALFHVLLFLFFARFLALTVTTPSLPVGEPALEVTLHHQLASSPSDVERQSADVLAVPTKGAADVSLVDSRAAPPAKLRSALNPIEPSAVTEASASAPESISSKGGIEAREVLPAVPADTVSADDLRQYRLSLGRAAKAHKHYPLLARERGLEGIAVVVVSTGAGLAVPQVSLSASSGTPMLDAQALEMVRLAVRDAKIPDGLLHRDFGIDLPIKFSLDD